MRLRVVLWVSILHLVIVVLLVFLYRTVSASAIYGNGGRERMKLLRVSLAGGAESKREETETKMIEEPPAEEKASPSPPPPRRQKKAPKPAVKRTVRAVPFRREEPAAETVPAADGPEEEAEDLIEPVENVPAAEPAENLPPMRTFANLETESILEKMLQVKNISPELRWGVEWKAEPNAAGRQDSYGTDANDGGWRELVWIPPLAFSADLLRGVGEQTVVIDFQVDMDGRVISANLEEEIQNELKWSLTSYLLGKIRQFRFSSKRTSGEGKDPWMDRGKIYFRFESKSAEKVISSQEEKQSETADELLEEKPGEVLPSEGGKELSETAAEPAGREETGVLSLFEEEGQDRVIVTEDVENPAEREEEEQQEILLQGSEG